MLILLPILLLGAGVGVAVTLALASMDSAEPAPPIAMPGPVASGGSGISLDSKEIEALARTIASEAGSGTSAEQKAIAWTVRNRFRGKSIYDMQYPWRSQKGANPPYSSARNATTASRQLAEQVIKADQSADPTGGATSFFEPRMQDAFFKAGVMARNGEIGNRVINGIPLTDITRFKSYNYDANALRKKWSKGSTLFAIADRFEFWGNSHLFAQRGGEVKTVVGGGKAFADIVDPLDFLS